MKNVELLNTKISQCIKSSSKDIRITLTEAQNLLLDINNILIKYNNSLEKINELQNQKLNEPIKISIKNNF